jgi:hypothetical protein
LRNAALFFAAMAPCVGAWQLWVSQHMSRSWDLVTLYYTNYVGFQIYNVRWQDLPLVVWHNIDGFLMGIGKALIFDEPVGSKHLERVIAIAAVAGSIRLTRRIRKFQYPAAALGISAVLLVWHYPPDQRFVFPLYPLLLAGLWTEVANVCRAFRISWNKRTPADRAAAVAGAVMVGALGAFIAVTLAHGTLFFVPQVFAAHGAEIDACKPAYRWISDHARQDASVFAYDDPLVYLYTGRKACGLPIPPKLFYHGDDNGIERLLRTIPDFAREYRLDYALLTPDDFYRDLHAHGAEHLRKAVESSGAFEPVFETHGLSVYRYNSRYDASTTPADRTASRTSDDVRASSSRTRLSLSRVRIERSSSVQ